MPPPSPKLAPRWRAAASALVLGLGLTATSLARADLDGQQACLDRESGSSCTRSSGAIGTCVAEPTQPGVLTCEATAAAGGAAGNAGAGGKTAIGAAGYAGTGTGTGAQGGSVDGLTCGVSTVTRPGDGVALLGLALVGAAGWLARARRER